MNFIRRFSTVLFCSLLAAVTATAASGYQFRHLPTGMKLSSQLVNVIFQDDDGFIYFGTASGLDRYDGYSVHTYARDDADSTALHDNYIEHIQQDPQGRLWVRAGGVYSILDPSSDLFIKNMRPVYQSMGMDGDPYVVTFASDGSCWMWEFGKGVARYKDGITTKVDDPDSLLLRDIIHVIIEAGPDRVLTIDKSGNIVFIDTRTTRINSHTRVPGSYDGQDRVYTAFTDRENMVWIYTYAGLNLYNTATSSWMDTFGGTPLPQGNITALTQDHLGRIWIGYDHDALAILERDGRITHVGSDPADDRSLSSATVTALMEDRTGSMWLGSRKNGVSIYNDCTFKFDFTPFPDVNNILGDENGNIWLATDANGLIQWNKEANTHRIIDTSRPGNRNDAIVKLAKDSQGNLWAGTYGAGLLKVDPAGRVQRFTQAEGLANDNVWAIEPMPDGSLLLATLGGGVQRYNPVTKEQTTFNINNSELPSDYVSSMTRGADGIVYIGTSQGIMEYSIPTNILRPGASRRIGDCLFAGGSINQVMYDSRGLLWVATREGMNVYDSTTDSLYTLDLGKARRFVLGMAEDRTHGVWITVGGELLNLTVTPDETGCWIFDIHPYDSSDGLQPCDFNQRSVCTLPDGEMMVGGFYGVNSFRPDGLKFGTTRPHVYFTGLSLASTPVRVGAKYGGRVILPQRISRLKEIELDYGDNEFSISFAVDDYINPEKTVYYYKLDGFSDEWRQLPGHAHSVAYTNLSPGYYTLHVKAMTADGVESNNIATLGIRILPPFYATTIAKIIYAILILAIVSGAFIMVRRHERRLSRSREQAEAMRKQEELEQLKFRFFTNVSHELRTPLSLITAPLESLLKNPMDQPTRDKLELIHGNADRLLKLVNQLLDFRKSEVAGLTLNPSQGDIVRFVRGMCESFSAFAETKHITLSFFSTTPGLTMQFDEDKMGKIVMNLLGNAFKYTPDGGRIDVTVSVKDTLFELTVSDSGCGISDEDKPRVFERFYQVNDGRGGGGGTGIGLSLVAEFARLHGGTVDVADNHPEGTTFTVTIPINLDLSSGTATTAPSRSTKRNADSRPALLIVDDNPDLLKFISSELSSEYNITLAADGAEAIAEVRRHHPDLIISDLMMPNMDGIELCRRLKSDPSTAAIPLLLLTAKHEVNAKIEGLTLGADDYMTKPFNIDVLRLRLKKLLDLRGMGAKRALLDPEPKSISITSMDEKFIGDAVDYVDRNMSRADLSVEELAAELNMSRVHLYKRIKQLTGKTPIEFLRVLRLKRSAQLLRESQLNISEIAYRCGFNNPKYFSRYFKEEFGVLPSAYQEKEGK